MRTNSSTGRSGRIETLRAQIEHALAAGDVEFRSCGDAASGVDGPRRTPEPVDVDETAYPG
jgi:hypothetical protein